MFNVQQVIQQRATIRKKTSEVISSLQFWVSARTNKSWNLKTFESEMGLMNRHVFLERSWRSDDCSHLFGIAF